jgi:cytochrome P450
MGDIPRIRDFDDPAYDPFLSDEAMFGDMDSPYEKLAALRTQGSVHEGDFRQFLGLHQDLTTRHLRHYTVVGYDEVTQILNDPETFSNETYKLNLGICFGKSISTMDGAEHQRYRKIFQKAFLPNIVSKWGDSLVDPVIDELLGKFIQRGTADLVKEFTLYYPFHIIYRQLNLPPQDIATFHKLAIAQIVVSYDMEHGTEASIKLGEYFRHLIEQSRKSQGDDLISVLAHAEVEGEILPEEVLISFLRQLVNAGGDTTYRTTSVLLAGLLSNPEQLDAVRKDRTLVAQAIEEALRWDGPVLMQSRFATRDVMLGGVMIPAGSAVDACAGAANRDPKYFPNPDKFDIFRAKGTRHYGFAAGPHICIGQHLARVEMTRALNGILDKLPNVRLDPDMPPPRIQGGMMRAPKHIYVRFDA